MAHAREFLGRFVSAYNTHHRHSGIGFHTPADVHFGMTDHVDDQRLAALAKARVQHPERFGSSRLPKKLQLPDKPWNNDPIERKEAEENNVETPAA